jgi:hypothetical protein
MGEWECIRAPGPAYIPQRSCDTSLAKHCTLFVTPLVSTVTDGSVLCCGKRWLR